MSPTDQPRRKWLSLAIGTTYLLVPVVFGVFDARHWSCLFVRDWVSYALAIFGYGILGAWLFSLTRPRNQRDGALFGGILFAVTAAIWGALQLCNVA